jgi:N-formylglutamate amidohydrolase
MKSIKRIVLNIPHCSTKTVLEEWDSTEIIDEVFKWTDLFTDFLFEPKFLSPDYDIVSVKGAFSRFTCDFERLVNDPLNTIGQGIIYTRFGNFKRNISEQRKQEIMDTIYYPYIDQLKSKLTDKSLLIDCHSFPAEVAENIDVNLGFNEDWSKPSDEIITFIADYFKSNGLNVALNFPYSNSMSPECAFTYPSIMIELNKKLYLNPDNTLKSNANHLKEKLTTLYSIIL